MSAASFYTAIARWYDDLFGRRGPAADFLHNLRSGKPGRILDIGCATGELMLELSRRGHRATGLDLDPALLVQARSKLAGVPGAVLAEGDMCDVARIFPAAAFDLAACIGNTLPHLASHADVRMFIKGAHTVLAPAGILVLQLLNHELLEQTGGWDLPVIENDRVRFERNYGWESGMINFRSLLLVKADGRQLENIVTHTVIKPAELAEMLKTAGCAETAFFSGFNSEPFKPSDRSFVLRSVKKA